LRLRLGLKLFVNANDTTNTDQFVSYAGKNNVIGSFSSHEVSWINSFTSG
jgi:hypothetical protein